MFSQDLNISNWSWAPLDKRKLFQGIIISVLFCWSSIHQLQTKLWNKCQCMISSLQNNNKKTQMIWWSNFVICEFKSLNILIPFYLPQTINIDFMKLWACAIMGGGHGEQALLALHGWKMISPTIQFHMWTRWVQYDFSHIINIQGSRFYLLQIGYTYYHFNICSSNSDLFYFIFSWNKFLVAFLEAFEFFRLNFFTKIHKIWKKNEENIFKSLYFYTWFK